MVASNNDTPADALAIAPFQCLAASANLSPNLSKPRRSAHVLFAASGPQIISHDLKTGRVLATWPEEPSSVENEQREDENGGPPSKKRKRESSIDDRPNIIKLVAAPDEGHLVAITAEDKCLRVLQIGQHGRLTQLSARCMPKRPCAIAISSDSKSVLCGDKYGDVYALPLQYEDAPAPPEQPDVERVAFKPAASERTVHSKRNRQTLEAQMKLASIQKAKEPLKFAHQLLLGHVSMLTDMLLVSAEDAASGKSRQYSITADRDEHIRVSRGPPQAHITEGFCLGHQNFVSKLCLLTPDILVSGGGDHYLIGWDWRAGKELFRIDLVRDNTDKELAVSGLWAVPTAKENKVVLVVTLEDRPILLSLLLDTSRDLTSVDIPRYLLETQGPVLDVAVVGDSIIVAEAQQDTETNPTSRLSAMKLRKGLTSSANMWELDRELLANLKGLSDHSSVHMSKQKVKDVFCGIANLRKHGHGEAEAEAE